MAKQSADLRTFHVMQFPGDGPFVSVPLSLVPTVGKTGGQTRKDRPYMSEKLILLLKKT